MKKIIIALLVVMALVFSLSVYTVLAQDICEGNFDCDQDVDGTDAAVFKSDFGRSQFNDPCPTCQENPCPCPGCALTVCGFEDPAGLEICLSSGEGDCCCCVPLQGPSLIGFCTDSETCLSLEPHPLFGPYDCVR